MSTDGSSQRPLGEGSTQVDPTNEPDIWEDRVCILQADCTDIERMSWKGPLMLCLQTNWNAPFSRRTLALPAASGRRRVGFGMTAEGESYGFPEFEQEPYIGAWCVEYQIGAVSKLFYADLRAGIYALPPCDQVTVTAVLNQYLGQAERLTMGVQASVRPGYAGYASSPWTYTYQGLWTNPIEETYVVGQVLIPPNATRAINGGQGDLSAMSNDQGLYGYNPKMCEMLHDSRGVDLENQRHLAQVTPVDLAWATLAWPYGFWAEQASGQGQWVPYTRFWIDP